MEKNLVVLEKSWKGGDGMYVLQYVYDGFVGFRLYAREQKDKKFKIGHGLPWDVNLNKSLGNIRSVAGLPQAYKIAYARAHAQLNGTKEKQLSLALVGDPFEMASRRRTA